MKKIFFLCLLCLCSWQSYAQHTVSGTIRDKNNGEALIGVSVYVAETKSGASSNVYGFYSLAVPRLPIEVTFSYVGYKTKKMPLNPKGDSGFNIELEPDGMLEEVVIKAPTKVQNTEISTVKITPKDIKSMPSMFGEPDIQQVIVSQAGVSSVGEGTSGFNVRGGKTDQNLVLVDEAPLYNTSHLYGFVTVVDPEAVKNIKFYKGGIPARYGGRSASVLDIQLKDGNLKKVSGSAAINPIVSKLSLEVPIIKDKLNVYGTVRRSFVDAILPAVNKAMAQADTTMKSDADNGFNVYFYDATAKVNYFLNNNNKIFLSGYWGRDMNSSGFSSDGYVFKTKFSWGDQLGSLRWNHIFSPKLFSNLTLLTGNYDFLIAFKNKQSGLPEFSAEMDTYIKSRSAKYDVSYFPNNNLSEYFGLGFTTYNVSSFSARNGGTPPPGAAKSAIEYWAYADAEGKIGEKFSYRAGLRLSAAKAYGPNYVYTYDKDFPQNVETATSVTFYGANENIKDYGNIEPRIALNYQVNDGQSVKIAFDRMAQYIHKLSNTAGSNPFDIWTPVDYYLPPTLANQWALGTTLERGKYSFEAEIFYKKMRNMLEFRDNVTLVGAEAVETTTVPAEARSYGVELSANKNQGKLQGYVNYTYSRTQIKTLSEYGAIQLNSGNYFFANYDRPHIANAVLTYPTGKRSNFSAKFTYQSGRPVSMPTGKIGELVTFSERNAFRISDTHRLDLSWALDTRTQKKLKGQWVFSIYNVYKRKNAFSYFPATKYDAKTNERNYTLKGMAMVGMMLPSFAYNIHF